MLARHQLAAAAADRLFLLQLLCLLTFWLLLRQALTEKRDRQEATRLSTVSVQQDGRARTLRLRL